MHNELILRDINIPYGVLHDQKLINVEYKENKIIFDFEIEVFENDFYDKTQYEKFKNFKSCKMAVQITNEEDNCYYLESCLKKNKGRNIEIDKNEFANILKQANYFTFGTLKTDGNIVDITFFTGFYDIKGKYKKYKKYDGSCTVTLCAEKITWDWH